MLCILIRGCQDFDSLTDLAKEAASCEKHTAILHTSLPNKTGFSCAIMSYKTRNNLSKLKLKSGISIPTFNAALLRYSCKLMYMLLYLFNKFLCQQNKSKKFIIDKVVK